MKQSKIRLGVNIDHVATIRNARGGVHPSPVKAANLAQKYGADGITIHLREDRRHIRDEDLKMIKESIKLPINLEMAATTEMLDIALETKPNAACIVPEKRQEVTTEGGLDVIKYRQLLEPIVKRLHDKSIRVSLFVDANQRQIKSAKEIGADIIEIHTGEFCYFHDELEVLKRNFDDNYQRIIKISEKTEKSFEKIKDCAKYATKIGLECHAGHGLNYDSAAKISKIEGIVELNIGHFLIGEAIFDGFEEVIKRMRNVIGG